MQPHQERVHAEFNELEDRRGKLATFLKTELYQGLPDEEKAALSRQFAAMGAYAQALTDRISLWMK
jgi:hypothetical protein